MIGAVARLAGSAYTATRLKCCTAKGVVASPATRLAPSAAPSQATLRWKAKIGQGALISRVRGGQASASATRAAVAAKDIWKPGWATASGCSASTISAATASALRLIARRSSRMARKATVAVTAARIAGAGAPDSTR